MRGTEYSALPSRRSHPSLHFRCACVSAFVSVYSATPQPRPSPDRSLASGMHSFTEWTCLPQPSLINATCLKQLSVASIRCQCLKQCHLSHRNLKLKCLTHTDYPDATTCKVWNVGMFHWTICNFEPFNSKKSTTLSQGWDQISCVIGQMRRGMRTLEKKLTEHFSCRVWLT